MARAKTDPHTLPLIGGRIVRIESVVDGQLVSVPNSSDARHSISADGRRWVRKRQLETGYEALLAEALGWMLARELKVPVPAGAVTDDNEDLSWLSETIPFVEHWDAERAHFIQNMDDLGRMLTFDAIIHNADRHAGNILLQPNPTEMDLRVWCIDSGDSFLGHPEDFARIGLSVPPSRNIARGLPISLLREGAMVAAEDAARLNQHLLRSIVDEACSIVAESKRDVLLEALSLRMTHASQLATEYVAQLEKHP